MSAISDNDALGSLDGSPARYCHVLGARVVDALRNGQLTMVYQPIFDLATLRVVGAEALVRWKAADSTHLPDTFIPHIEGGAAIVELGRFSLKTALVQTRRWNAAGRDMRIAVNVSPYELVDRDFVARLRTLLRDARCSPEVLELELTERPHACDIDEIGASVRCIRALGVSVALDDFGSGENVPALLERVAVDTIKIDRSTIAQMTWVGNSDASATLHGLIAFAKRRGLRVVAEGVESGLQLATLLNLRCDAVKGYFIGAPCAAAEFAHVFL